MKFRGARAALAWWWRYGQTQGVGSVWPRDEPFEPGGALAPDRQMLIRVAITLAIRRCSNFERRVLFDHYLRDHSPMEIAARRSRNPERIHIVLSVAARRFSARLRKEGLLG